MDILLLFHKVTYEHWMVAEGKGRFCSTPMSQNFTPGSVNDTPNLGRYVADLVCDFCLRVKPKTMESTACSVNGALGCLLQRHI